MKKSAAAGLLALALLLTIGLTLPSSAAAKKKKKKAWPNLVITHLAIKQLPGDPPYVLEDESGHTPGFVVDVTTENIGRAVAKRSRTQLEFTEMNGTNV